MTKYTGSTTTRLAAAVLGVSLLAGACADETASSSATVPAVDVESPATTAAPTTTEAPATTVPPSATAATVATATEQIPEPAPDTTPPPAPPEEPDEPEELPEAAPAPTCGEFGPIPPMPDSMPTLVVDTDGDGADDEVTAYGAVDGWRVRVVQNDIVSEAVVDTIPGFAFLSSPIPTDAGDQIVLAENDTTATWTFATNDEGCIELIDQYAPAGDEDAMICGPLPAIPGDALVGEAFWFDFGDGEADNFLVAYQHDGVWRLRAELQTWENGPIAQSEIEIPGAGVHGVRVIGFADVDDTYGGEEIVVRVGGGASTIEVGLFQFLEGGCLARYTVEGGGSYSQSVGGTIGSGTGLVCNGGWLSHYGYELANDDTYTVWATPYEPTGFLRFGMVPDIDGYYEEGLSYEEASADLFDCNGLSL